MTRTREETIAFLSGLDKDDVIVNVHWILLGHEQRMESQRVSHEFQLARATDIGDRARAWWDHCVAEKQRGRKTVRMEGWV